MIKPTKKIFIVFFLSSMCLTAQNTKKSVIVKYINQEIKIDAILDESVWSQAPAATDFFQYFPVAGNRAKQQAAIKLLFDDSNLYVGIKVQSSGRDFIIPSLQRDFRAGGSDNITLLFDTFNDGNNAFLFGSNPYGVRREMLLSGGGNDNKDFNAAWDTKWFGESKIHDNHYILEWKIPLSAFKYRAGETKWRLNSYHFDTQDNERNTWMEIPQNQYIFNLAYMGDMIFEKPLGKSKSPISIIPYINTLSAKDFTSGKENRDFKFGADAKLTIANSMNLDITVNPDFSQVEVDRQVTNLSRFEISLPERRQFFIENSDLFSDYGKGAHPFFSRRIGIAKNKDGENIENKIIAGVRLSGKLNNNLRLGILSVQTDEDLKNEIPTANNSAISIQQKLFSRSNISFLFLNKEVTKDYTFLAEKDRYNRVFGIDYNLASADNKWTGKYFFHKSFSPGIKDNDFSTAAYTSFNNRRLDLRLYSGYVADDFRSDMGFIRRTGVLQIASRTEVKFWPQKGKIQRYSFAINPYFFWRPKLNFENSDYRIIGSWEAQFKSTSKINVKTFSRYTKLYNTFDPTRTGGDAVELPIGDYHYTNLELEYESDRRKKLSYSLEPSVGEFYNGDKYSLEANAKLRLQPYFTCSVQLNYDKVNLPNPYPDASIWLIGPQFDVTFSKNMFWSTFVQYSTQRENFSVNTRFQWRFAPLSDLFLVYNDNYATDIFSPKFRSINLKLTYWLNI